MTASRHLESLRLTLRVTGVLLVVATSLLAEPEPRKLVIALEQLPPFEYEQDGKAHGINVEVFRRIFTRLQVPFEFRFYPWSRTWMLLKNGRIDATSLVSYQPFREKVLIYSDAEKAFAETGMIPPSYLLNADYRFFVSQRHAKTYASPASTDPATADNIVGIIRDYSYQPGFVTQFKRTKTYPSIQNAIAALNEGLVDLVPMEKTIGEHVTRRLGLDGKITCLSTTLFSKPYHLTFSRESDYPAIDDLSQQFNEALIEMRRSGEYDSIRERYIPPDYLAKITRPLSFVCEKWAPLEYIDNGVTKGIDVCVVDHIMNRLRVPYTISIFPWSRAWMLAEKGKADAVLSISYKKSREPVLYYTDDQRLFDKTGALPANYLWMSEYVFFVKKQAATRFRFESYEQLKRDGIRVGRNRDYSYDAAFRAAAFDGPIFSNTEEGLLALVADKIDLYPMDKTVGCAELTQLGLRDSVTHLERPLFSKPYLSPFCRNSDFPALEQIMNAFYRELRLMRADGSYQRIRKACMSDLMPAATGPSAQ